MILNITNNFSRSVNMDPEIGSPPCVTYLMIDFDSLFSDKAFLKLANFEFYRAKTILRNCKALYCILSS